mgnify:FL=1
MKVIEVKKLYKVFSSLIQGQPSVIALDDVSLSIAEGSLTVIGGANGSGKSVLMSIIAGLQKASDGTCFTASKPGLIFQDAASQILGDTPRDDIAVGPRNQKVGKKEIPLIVEKALAETGLSAKADWPAHFLSGGEKRRLAVASILAMKKDIIIFDEPYANLDYPGVCDLNALIQELHQNKKTVLLLTHEIEKCLGMANQFVILHRGKIVFDGSPLDALAQPLESWGIKNPLSSYKSLEDLIWQS